MTVRSLACPLVAAAALALAAFGAAGCGGTQIETDPPEGWQADGDRWWTPGADTTRAFRDLTSLTAMGVATRTPVLTASQEVTGDQMILAAKQGLEKLYRKAPETVDSLFVEHVAPKVKKLPRTGDVKARMKKFTRKSHERLTSNYFRVPTQTRTLGEDIPMSYPDSLFDRGVSGRVHMQVRVDTAGQPRAIKVIDGVHPVLDAIAQRATTKMRWDPARVKEGDYGWKKIPSWTWMNVSFGRTS